MWIYEKKLQYPVKITTPNARLAGLIIDALGGPDGETGAAMRYLNQRYTMPSGKIIGTLTDIGSEELGHMEIVASLVHQLTRNLTPAEITAGGFDKYYIGHGVGIYPASASGEPFNAVAISSKGDAICDLNEDLAADAAIIKEQPLRKKSQKPLKYKAESLAPQSFSDLEPKAFSHLGKTPENCIPAII